MTRSVCHSDEHEHHLCHFEGAERLRNLKDFSHAFEMTKRSQISPFGRNDTMGGRNDTMDG
jgi:hypothetical protein